MVIARSTSKHKKATCKPKACPTCGGLECFDRPRFFSGQLVNDKDLNGTLQYVIEKNRLHNRYLVGTGVACGLAVRCHPSCNGVVIVDSGYAIDCCGNDLVVCESTEFDVIKYLEDCFKPEQPLCNDKIRTRNTQCDNEGPQEYCLVISYTEEPTTPVSALIRDNGCSTSRCEPSRTRESFRFDLIKKENTTQQSPSQNFWNRFQQCNEFFTKLGQLDLSNNLQSFYRLKAFVWEFYQQEVDTRCNLVEELRAIEAELPTSDPAGTVNSTGIANAINKLRALFIQLWLDCWCNALLTPCVDCDPEQGVLLACLTIQKGKILRICNTVRQQLITGPMLRYFLPLPGIANQQEFWLLSIYNIFTNFNDQFCCGTPPRGDLAGVARPGGFASFETRAFSDAGTPLTRQATAFSMARDFPNAPWIAVNALNLSQSASTDTLTALDIYDRSVEEVRALLQSHNITAVENTASAAADLFTPGNLSTMAWTIPQGSRVELVINPQTNRIALIRLLQGGSQ